MSVSNDLGECFVRGWDPSLEPEMFVTATMKLCTKSVALCVRFLAGLCREGKPRRGGCWVRLRLGSDEDALVEMLGITAFLEPSRNSGCAVFMTFSLPDSYLTRI